MDYDILRFYFGPLAQLVEQETLNLLVVGSIPTRPTTIAARATSARRRSPTQDHPRQPRKPGPREPCALERRIGAKDQVGVAGAVALAQGLLEIGHRDLHYPLRRQRQMCIRDSP